MSNPANPLDIFVSNTYHFELHAADSWDKLRLLENHDANDSTTALKPTGTLMINTRKDAHQTIDNVRFCYTVANAGKPAPGDGTSGQPDITMEVTEPGGMFLVQKIRYQNQAFDIKHNSMIWALKIFFVGRLSSGEIKTIGARYLIPMNFQSMSAQFNLTGGHYVLGFTVNTSLTPHVGQQNSLAYNAAYVNKTISISAVTVKEAIVQLEQKLNDNYAETYETTCKNSVGARQLRYKLLLDPRIDGALSLTTLSSTQPGDKQSLIFPLSEDIGKMIDKILYSSKEVNDLVAASRGNINAEFQPGVRYITVTPMFCPRDGVSEVTYNIKLFEGGRKDADVWEFDYYFTEAGRNVDIINFDLKFPELAAQGWSSKTDEGADKFINLNAIVPKNHPAHWSANTLTPDIKIESLGHVDATPVEITAGKGDTAWLPLVPRVEGTGQVGSDYMALNSARLAFDVKLASSLVNPEVVFTIRGNVEFLERCITYPDPSLGVFAFGTTSGMWAKVNIYGLDENKQRIPFFFTGYYMVMQIENVFQNGMFLQLLKMMMSDLPVHSLIATTSVEATKPVTTTSAVPSKPITVPVAKVEAVVKPPETNAAKVERVLSTKVTPAGGLWNQKRNQFGVDKVFSSTNSNVSPRKP